MARSAAGSRTETGSAAADQRRLVAALARELERAHGAVTTLETHISHVLIAGDCAYKIKKALRLPFVDYSTLARRRRFCGEELRLNRRLAPQLYRDVVAITGTPDAPSLGGEGRAIEYAVRMRAFAQDALLSECLARGELAPSRIDEFAREVAAFHAGLPPASPRSRHGTPAQALADALANFDAIAPLAEAKQRGVVARLRDWTIAEFARCEAAMARRRRDGRVRECHGDLHLRNVALVDGRVTVFDGIEFSPRLRWIDVAGEAAFAAMDLAARGRDDYAWRFLNAWLEDTGDYGSVAVLRFHLVYRAMVRAKVRYLRAAQAGAADCAKARAEAEDYVALAGSLAGAVAPALVVMHGPSGTGKTTLSQRLLEKLPAVRIRTDVERKRLHGYAPDAATGSAVDSAIYAADATRRTYDQLAAHAQTIAAAGYTALLDGTFLRRWQRDRMREPAARLGVPFVIVAVEVPEAILRRRVAARASEGRDASEATVEVLERQLAQREPLAADERPHAVVLDGTLPPDDPSFAAMLDAVAAARAKSAPP
ncbi:MAG: AAA family ATPase [Betaproteobacteria bacterium]|nr:AAA family ATPase [Betaproteobacteria bacterium]